MVILALEVIYGAINILVILISYLFIFSTILKIRSAEGKSKAFSTCTSHLTAVSIFYGTAFCTHLTSSPEDSRGEDKVVSVFYTVVIPMLNLLIYSLRNKEVKDALRVIEKKILSLGLNT